MTVIYGLRESGEVEIRYVGRTNKELSERLRKHVLNASRGYPPRVSAWLGEASSPEIVELAVCAPEAACATERQEVERLHGEGHRLTNSHLLPRKAAA